MGGAFPTCSEIHALWKRTASRQEGKQTQKKYGRVIFWRRMGVEATPAFCPAWPSLPAASNSQPQAPVGRAAESQFLRIKVGLHALRGPCQHHRGPATLQALSVPEAAWLKLSTAEQRAILHSQAQPTGAQRSQAVSGSLIA